MNTIKIVLADDHQILLDGLRALFDKEEGIVVAGIYNNGLDMFNSLKNTRPDIALIDINMPGLNGLELTLKIKKECPGIRVMTLSMFDDINHIMQLVKAGVSAYLFKNISNDELLKAIREVDKGNLYFSPGISARVSEYVKAERSRQYQVPAPALTSRELEILKLIATEYSNAQIGDKLFISERTVETHRKNMLRKTNHKNMVGLLKYVLDNGLI
jgi:DNA-binding NarL/FixJ family response regulator